MPNYMGDIIKNIAGLFQGANQPTPPPISDPSMSMMGNMGMPQIPQAPNNVMTPPLNGPIPMGGMNQQIKPNSIFDDYIESARNPPPVWEQPSWMRMLGTALYSGIRHTEDDVTESTNARGETSRVVHKGKKAFLSPEEVDYYLNLPTNRKLADWKLRNTSLKEGANVETQKENYLSLQDQRRTNAELARKKEGRLQVDSDIKNLTSQQKIELASAKQALEKWKAENPRGQVVMPRGGNVTLVNPISGEATDTGIPTGLLTELEMQTLKGQQRTEQIALQGENQLANTAAVGQNQQNNIQLQGQNQQENILASGQQARETKQTVPGANPNSNNPANYPSQQIQGQRLKANMAIQTHPEWAQYINIDPNTGLVNITPPKDPKAWFGSGPDPDTWALIVSYITGIDPRRQATPINQLGPSQVSPENQTGNILAQGPMGASISKTQETEMAPSASITKTTQIDPTKPPKSVSTVPQGYVLMKDGNGNLVVIPQMNVQKAKNQGYVEVKK